MLGLLGWILFGFPFNEPWRRSTNQDGVTSLAELDSKLLSRGQATVWTGDSMVVTGGITTTGRNSGESWVYAPPLSMWYRLAPQRNWAPRARSFHSAVWTGSEVLIFGGSCGARHMRRHLAPRPTAVLPP